MRKVVGFALLIGGALLLALVLAAHLLGPDAAGRGSAPRVVVSESTELDRYGSGGLRTGDGPRIRLPTEPGSGELFHVSANADPGGDGSRERPWRSLTDSLCRLSPGDRLVVLDGAFTGPVAIDRDCADGNAGRPIEVYFGDDVVVRGLVPSREPVFAINRSHWTIAGLQVLPGPVRTGIAIAPDVRGVELRMVKVNRGDGVAMRVGYGATDVLLSRLHVHHMGFTDGSHEPGPADSGAAAAVVIEPGVTELRIVESKFHQIGGARIRVIDPDSFSEVPGLPAAEFSVDAKTQRPGEGDRWW